MAITIINRRLDLHQFKDYVTSYYFGTLPANKLVIHHTRKPTTETWAGERTIAGLKRYYEGKGWTAGPHLFIAEDGIWLFTPMREDGIHAGQLNHRSIGMEVVGDYDQKTWSGRTRYHAPGVISILKQKLGISNSNIFFHRDASTKTCPGKAITKEWLFGELENFRLLPRLPGLTDAMVGVTNISASIPGITPTDSEIMIPVWAAEAVAFVKKNQLFEIRSDEDVRDAVKFYRLYNLIQPNS